MAKQISVRMRAKNLSILSLEKEAGLKSHAVRNILRGKSKRPSADIVQSIADILGCTVKDLLESNEILKEACTYEFKNEHLKDKFEYPNLYMDTVKFVNELLKQKNKKLTIQQALTCYEEIYLHSCKKDPLKVDQQFGKWWISLVLS